MVFIVVLCKQNEYDMMKKSRMGRRRKVPLLCCVKEKVIAMKKIWKKRVSLVMAMLLVMNVIFAYPVTAHAEESLPGDQDGFTVHSFEVNLVEGDTKTPITDESEVVAGDEVEVKFEWTLDNSVRIPEEDVDTWTSAEFTIDTNDAQFKYSGINIPGMKVGEETAPLPLYATGAGTEVGSYYMKDGIIHIIITDKTFFQHEDNRYGGVSFSGTIANNGDKTEDGEPKEISFGTHSSNPNYYLENTESSAHVSKSTSGDLVKNGDKYYQTFTVTIKANNGTVTNIDLTDSVSPADMLSNPTDVQITASTATGLATGSYASLDEAFAAIKANTFYKDESITLQYTMEVDASVYEQNAEWYKNIVSGTYESNRSEDPKNVSAEAGVYVEKPYVNKAGVSFERRDGKGYVTWKITINLGDYYTGSSNDLADYLKSITDLPGAGLTQDGESLPLNPDYFVQDSNNPAIYTYVYETEVEEAIANSTSDETVKNKVTVTTQDDNIYTSNEAGYTIPGIGPSVEKTILSKVRDNEGLHVTWNIRVADIPKSGITALTVNDDSRHYNNNPGNQNLLYEIYIDDVLVADANGIIDTDKIKAVNNWNSGQYGSIILQDAYVNDVANADGEINIQVKTLVTEDTIGKEYGNMANVSYKDTTTGSSTTTPDSRATFQDATNLLTKTGAVVAGEDCIDYTVKVSLPPLGLTEAGKHFIIDDILPIGMQLKADSASVRLTDQWGNEKHVFACTPTTSNVTVGTETAIKISFDVETADEWISKLVGYNGATSGGYYLVVTYRAELTDRAGFIQDGVTKEFTNSVSGTYDGETIGSDKATNSMNPSQIVYKTAEYTRGTAPFIKYTVDVNPDAVTLLDGTAKLQAVDEIGSALKFVDADYFDNAEKKTKYRVQVLDIETSNELILGSDYTYTMAKNRRSISFELPDSKALRIIYWAYAEPGTTLTAENSTNSFSLSGMSSDVAGDEYSFDMVAYTPNGWTGSEVGSIILYKFWTDEGEQVALEGSVFRLERVQYDEETGTFVPKEVNGSSIILDNITVSDENRYDTGKIIIENLPVNQVMALYEISSPDGFAINRKPYYFVLEGSTAVTLPDEYNVTIYQSGSTMDYENHEAAVLVLEKTVEGDVEQADIEGVITFTVTDENGILIGTYQPGEGDFTYADGKWKLTLEDLEPGVYTVEETVYNATGHVARKVLYSIDAGSWSAGEKDTEAEVTLEENTTTTVTFKNVYDGFDVLVSKTMLTGGATLAGARLQITGTQADGTQITPIEWTSSVSAYCVKLYPGSYVLEELEAPTGYKKAASVAFTVDEDGTLTVDSQTVDEIEMQDEEISAELIKVDAADNDTVLEGATIGLYDEEDVNNDGSLKDDATALVSWTTSATPYDFGSYLTCGKNYYLVETVAPNGYELAAPIAISVSAAGEVSVTSNDITVTDGVIYMEDTAVAGDFGSLVLTKTIAGEWNNPDLDGKVTFKVESIDVVPAFSETYTLGEGSFLWDDVAGKYILTLNNLPVGTYKVTETLGSSTPENMSCTVTYTVNAGASENGTETGNVSVDKDAETAVAYTNTYAILKGSIQVSKNFAEATGTLT